MANSVESSGIPVESWQKTLHSFTGFCDGIEDGMSLDPVSLVANHDPTLRFTNSTTSVMKPYILDPKLSLDSTMCLIQPAMGAQGIHAWRDRRYLGPYASYFHSMGILYPASKGEEAAKGMASLATRVWIPSRVFTV